ncbi:MAG: hypothetical protein VKS61_16205 [Candidatus Sericytochromatia bacterium]|nr:hypothetical protein [Candidatus Sericytochromatia bacterium]
MSDHEELPDPTPATEPAASTEDGAAEAAEAAEAATAGEAVTSGPARAAIRGIHPELLCQCQECEPDHVELQWFSPDEPRKTKGDAMLFCGRSSRKYFVPIVDLQAWLTKVGGPRRGRRSEG